MRRIALMQFLLLNQPSLVPFQDFPVDSTANPDLFAALGVDYFFDRSGTTVGLTLGIDRPASYRPPDNALNPVDGSAAVLVVRNQGRRRHPAAGLDDTARLRRQAEA